MISLPRIASAVLYFHTAVLSSIAISAFWSLLNERFDPHSAKALLARVAGAATFGGLLGGVGARVAARLRAIQTAWAHYRENRRKERMRRDVIRKHAQPREASGEAPRIRRVKLGDEADEDNGEELAAGADEIPAADPAARHLIIAPAGATVVSRLDRLVTTNAGHGYAGTTQGERMPGIVPPPARTATSTLTSPSSGGAGS